MIVSVPKYKHINEGFFDDIEDDLFDVESHTKNEISKFVGMDYEENTVKPNVELLLKYWNVENYTITCTGEGVVVDVDDNLYLPNKQLNKISWNDWHFGTVTGNVFMSNNKLTDWKAFPEVITGNCYANLNNIKNFYGAPTVHGQMVASKQNGKTDYPLTLINYDKRFDLAANENCVYVISKDKFGKLKDINEQQGYCIVKLNDGTISKCKLNDVNCLSSITNLLF